MEYPTPEICRGLLFPLIRQHMVELEPAPAYEAEQSGITKLQSIFAFMDRDEYEGTLGKGAYLFCSVIDGHPFSNGNKRLAVALLSYFLLRNGVRISVPSMDALRAELQRLFPNLRWEHVDAFRYPHEYFFYHLALIIADRSQKGKMTFLQEREAVRQLLEFIGV